jgi:hypothetical protein
MFRKIASLSVALIVAGGVMVAVPAQAAAKISNGVACTKSGATSKTSLGTYKCAKNPLMSSTKLTWLSTDCLAAAADAIKAQKDSAKAKIDFAAQIPVIELGITNLNADKVALQTKLDDANKRLEAAKLKLASAPSDSIKRLLTTAVNSWTSAVRAYTSQINRIGLSIKKLESAKLLATTKPAELVANVADSREGAKLICTKGF